MPIARRRREFATQIVRQLRAAGFEALLAGGCVRDLLLGQIPSDYDVATSATPEQVSRVFRRAIVPLNQKLGKGQHAANRCLTIVRDSIGEPGQLEV